MVTPKATYMVVTNDALELPVMIGTSEEVAAFMGITQQSLWCLVDRLRQGKRTASRSKYKVEKLTISEEDEE